MQPHPLPRGLRHQLKSESITTRLQNWILAGYCVLVIDPEGDHAQLEELDQVQVVDARHYLPEPTELVKLLHRQASIVVDISVLADPDKIDYVHRLRLTAEAHREERGFPHWVIYDEAHLLGIHKEARWTLRGGCVLSSFTPALVPTHEIDSFDVVLELTHANTSGGAASTVRRATVRFGSGPSRPFTIADRRIAHVRHRRKYADVSLPKERSFYFSTTDGQHIAPAGTMHDFSTAVGQLGQRALHHHLERGDFSRWLSSIVADQEFAAQVALWEDELLAHRAADVERIRRRLVRAVEERYLGAQDH